MGMCVWFVFELYVKFCLYVYMCVKSIWNKVFIIKDNYNKCVMNECYMEMGFIIWWKILEVKI